MKQELTLIKEKLNKKLKSSDKTQKEGGADTLKLSIQKQVQEFISFCEEEIKKIDKKEKYDAHYIQLKISIIEEFIDEVL